MRSIPAPRLGQRACASDTPVRTVEVKLVPHEAYDGGSALLLGVVGSGLCCCCGNILLAATNSSEDAWIIRAREKETVVKEWTGVDWEKTKERLTEKASEAL